MEKAAGHRVRIQNRYAVAEYESLEDAADALVSVGIMARDDVMGMLQDRVGWINGFQVLYL